MDFYPPPHCVIWLINSNKWLLSESLCVYYLWQNEQVIAVVCAATKNLLILYFMEPDNKNEQNHFFTSFMHNSI